MQNNDPNLRKQKKERTNEIIFMIKTFIAKGINKFNKHFRNLELMLQQC